MTKRKKPKSEFLSAFGTAFEVWKAITDEVLSQGGSDEDIRSLQGDEERLASIAAIIIESGAGQSVDLGAPVSDPGTLTIPPDATADQLIANAKAAFEKAGIPFTYFSQNTHRIVECDLELVRGKTLEVLTHRFGGFWTTRKGRRLQKSKGFDGNAAAFLVWVTQTKRAGWFVSIANTDDRLSPVGGFLSAPYFLRVEQRCGVGLLVVQDEWFDGFVLVAFRAI